MLKFVFIFVLSALGANRSIQVHPVDAEVVVSGSWIWSTHCVTDTTFTVSDGDTVFFTWFSHNGVGGYDLKGVKETLVVTKDTLIQHHK